MTLDDVQEYFVTFRNAMRKAGLSNTAYLHWRKQGYIPYHSQIKLSEASKGYLKVNMEAVNNYEIARRARMPGTEKQD